jgi:hypothetical protein
MPMPPFSRGGRKKKNGKPTYICASSQNQRTRVPSYFVISVLVRFWAFLDKRQGEFENTGKQIECVSKNSPVVFVPERHPDVSLDTV